MHEGMGQGWGKDDSGWGLPSVQEGREDKSSEGGG